MTRIAVISDVHGDLDALEAVLAAVDQKCCDEVWCLGDLVGRGPHPIECAKLVIERCTLVLVGNHDEYQCNPEAHENFLTPYGREKFWPTRRQLEADPRWPALREKLLELLPVTRDRGVICVHATPRDPLWPRIDTIADVTLQALALPLGSVVLFGHTHVPTFATYNAAGQPLIATGREAIVELGGQVTVDREVTTFLNPGSVLREERSGCMPSFGILDLDGATCSFEWHVAAAQEIATSAAA